MKKTNVAISLCCIQLSNPWTRTYWFKTKWFIISGFCKSAIWVRLIWVVSFTGLCWAHSCGRVFSCICSQLAFIDGFAHLSDSWLEQGLSGPCVSRHPAACLAYSSGVTRVPSTARKDKCQWPSILQGSTSITFATVPLTKASNMSKPRVSIWGD